MREDVLLVSFCNRSDTTGMVLAAIKADGSIRRWFDFGAHTPISACGIAYFGDTLYCACSDADASYIAVFDASGSLRDYVRLANVTDVHSICTDGTSIFAASTGTDEIVRLALSGLSRAGDTVWRAGGERHDLNHVNSVAFSGEHLLCAGFGPKNGPAWSDAYDGFVYDIEQARYLARGLFHPHSLVNHENHLYFCESAEGSLRTPARTLRYLDGYSRGLALRGNDYYVGASRGRRSTGLERYVLNPADAGVRAGRCALYAGTLDDPSQSRIIDLGQFAEEIYDISLVPESMKAAI